MTPLVPGIVAWLLAVPAATLLGYFALETLVGLPKSRQRPLPAWAGRLCVLVPAHDEAAGIAQTLAALEAVSAPGTEILVVADNCRDDTAAIARAAGAEVVERHDPSRRGKGYALACGRDHLAGRPGGPPDVVVVLDADCRLLPASLERLGATALAEEVPVQAVNLILADLSAPPMVQISSFAMVVKNLYRSRGMQRLGGAALLTGTGMAFPWKHIAAADLATGALAEDLALGIELTRKGHVPQLVPEAGVRSPAAAMKDALAQRRRWEHGFLDSVRAQALPLVLGGMRRRSLAEVLLGLHLLVPPLAMLVLISALFLVPAVLATLLGGTRGPLILMTIALALAALAITLAWVGEGRRYLRLSAVARAPLYILWKLPIYVGFLRNSRAEWQRTPRPADNGRSLEEGDVSQDGP